MALVKGARRRRFGVLADTLEPAADFEFSRNNSRLAALEREIKIKKGLWHSSFPNLFKGPAKQKHRLHAAFGRDPWEAVGHDACDQPVA